jgi:hypothetical protein
MNIYTINRRRFIGVLSAVAVCFGLLPGCTGTGKEEPVATSEDREFPRIVNVINFVRLMEPRKFYEDASFLTTDDHQTITTVGEESYTRRLVSVSNEMLYRTVVSQIDLMNRYDVCGTFLLQYDALMDSAYRKLFSSLPGDRYETGAWWEIPQPLVEKAGLKWRGRYPWDWYANVAFSVGYTPQEREKLVDTYMKDFKEVFGHYPKSVGSWHIDEHTLAYMHRKYGIVASCNCRDQISIDGYTMWGGYWNQAYYPSIKNAYMPAQTEAGQIPVPVFRMLGSDHMPQYDPKLKVKRQGTVTIEPAYDYSGSDSSWVAWYLKEFVEGPCMEYNYVQIGQENSFLWKNMEKGLGYQIPMIAKLRDEKKVKVETLAESGQWFREHYRLTPSTAVTVQKDLPGSDRKTVWFDSRFFRANFLWEQNTLRLTDVHIFDENFTSDYLKEKTYSDKYYLYTLPFIDGYTAIADRIDGLRLKARVNGEEILVEGVDDPLVDDHIRGQLLVTWPLKSIRGTLKIRIDEQTMEIKLESNEPAEWFLDLLMGENTSTHYHTISPRQIDCLFKGFHYFVRSEKGSFSEPGNGILFRISPENNAVILDFSKDS